nr:leucine-rich repeat domain-containing protein [Bacilli bacterium]
AKAPATSGKASPDSHFKWTKTYDGNHWRLAKYVGPGGDVVIPETHEGQTVVAIGEEAFCDNRNIVSVTMPKTMEVIGVKAFYACRTLKSVTFGRDTDHICRDAFSYCPELKSVVLNDGFTNLGDSAFASCMSLETVSLPSSVKEMGEHPFLSCENLSAISFRGKPNMAKFNKGWDIKVKKLFPKRFDVKFS